MIMLRGACYVSLTRARVTFLEEGFMLLKGCTPEGDENLTQSQT